ncbi:MAG: glycosyltransferase family 2 protein [Bacteroidales bacterium]|nr:glycosyltransferase family 2 protein [Bacteroidales bacterium]
MISICIPIHNFYAYPLARRLSNQAKSSKVDVEIICIDDHSSGYYLSQNKGLTEVGQYIKLAENVGKSKIRNLFLKYATGDYLLFLDDDSLVEDDKFLRKYSNAIGSNPQVVVGGRIYDERGNDQEHRLRYLYGTQIESRNAEERRKHPYQSFMTNNFLIRRDVLEQIKFDKRISKYGHEDTLFGYRLEQAGIPIVHIDNPVINGQVETNAEFLHKTVTAVENLSFIYNFMWEDQRFCQSVKLLRTYAQVRRLGLHKLVYYVFRMLRSPMESHFVSGTGISLKQFSFYKLGIFIKKIHFEDSEWV